MSQDDVIDAGAEELEAPPELGEAAVLPRLLKIPGGVPDLDADLRTAERMADGAPLKLRIQPAFYFKGATTKDPYKYLRWRPVCWIVELTPEDAIDLRVYLDGCMQAWVQRKQGEQEGR